MKLTVEKNALALYFLIIAGCFRWFFNGIFGSTLAEVVFASVGLVILIAFGRTKINLQALPWLLYAAVILFNMLIYGLSSQSTITFFILILEIILFPILISMKTQGYFSILRVLIVYGLINAGFVMIHFAMGARFADVYSRVLRSSAVETVDLYSRSGYYFGFFYTPADPAGLIALALFGILLYIAISRQSRYRLVKVILACLLFVPLFLTGKRGILFISLGVFIFMMVLLYATKRQGLRALGFIVVIVAALIIFYVIMRANQNIEIFARLNQFFTNLLSGDSIDSVRLDLWAYAAEAWRNHRVLGIGWRTFSHISQGIYGVSHEVNNDYLQILCELGIIGLIATLIPLVIMLRRCIVVCMRITKAYSVAKDQWIVFMGCFVQFFFVVYAIIEIPFYDITFFTLYMISCMIINRAYKDIKAGIQAGSIREIGVSAQSSAEIGKSSGDIYSPKEELQ